MNIFTRILSSFLLPTYCEDNRNIFVCGSEDVSEGQIFPTYISRKRILLCRVNGRVFAVSSRCTHQSGDLSLGFLNGYNLVCPMHGAEFDIRSGNLVNPPGFHPLSSYQTTEDSGKIYISLPKTQKIHSSKTTDSRIFLIIGAGAAGMSAAETLRRFGFSGRIVIISDEDFPPYDRVLLSKNLFLDVKNNLLFTENHLLENNYELRLNSSVKNISPVKVTLQNGEELKYDKILICTGASAKVPNEFMQNLCFSNFLTMRNMNDYQKIQHRVASAKRITVIGNRFLGLELVACIRKTLHDVELTFVEYESQALAKVVGKFLYDHIFQSMAENNVRVVRNKKIEGIENNGDVVNRIIFDDMIIDTDLVIVSTGSTLKTDHVPLELKTSDGAVKVNKFLQTQWPQIYSAGDIALYPDNLSQENQRIEHWVVAQQQGNIAALNMIGLEKEFEEIPYFWSQQFDFIEMAGFCFGAQNTINEDLGDKKISFFFKGDKCIGVAAVNMPMAVLKLKILMKQGKIPDYNTFLNGNLKCQDLLSMFQGCQNCEKSK
jgi:NADPH-dependent 2,4-dienoyl-CoA reductase/sulfur reductase-like enzyme/nitrite reductase/ring-hydroxylating ferredoxin subunit